MPKYADIKVTSAQNQAPGVQPYKGRFFLSDLKIKLLLSLAVIILTNISGADPAYAQNLEGLATRMLSLLSNNLMRTIATIAVILLGAGGLLGVIEGRKAFGVAIGIIIIFTAPFIVATISGG